MEDRLKHQTVAVNDVADDMPVISKKRQVEADLEKELGMYIIALIERLPYLKFLMKHI